MGTLAYTRTGAGAPMVLLHALGSRRTLWEPVVPALAERFDVLAVDLPGSGESPPLTQGEPHPAALAAAVAELLDGLGVTGAHVTGNSLGGWVALELAHLRPLASVTLLSPAGLWPGNTPRYCLVSLRVSRWLSRHARRALCRAVGIRAGRILVLGQTHGRPGRMSPAQARAAVRALGDAPGFDDMLRATARRHYAGGPAFDAPVTVAFGSRDRLLPPSAKRIDRLPAGTRRVPLPGCGHIPPADDPVAVAAVIMAGAGRARGGPRG